MFFNRLSALSTAVLLILTLGGAPSKASAQVPESERIYVSTMGFSAQLRGGSAGPPRVFLFRVATMEGARAMEQLLAGLTDTEDPTTLRVVGGLVNRLVSRTNYKEEVVYVLISPHRSGIKLHQPYRKKGGDTLIFDLTYDASEKHPQLFFRYFGTTSKKDRYRFAVWENDQLIMLDPVRPERP